MPFKKEFLFQINLMFSQISLEITLELFHFPKSENFLAHI